MYIHLEEVKRNDVALAVVKQVECFPSLVELQEMGACSFLEPLRVSINASCEFDQIRVSGSIATQIKLSCSRCLNEYAIELDVPFTIYYTKATNIPQDAELELAENDLMTSTYDGDVIDLTSEIAAQIIMEIPIKPLCNDDCRGLCSVCGAELNISECGCSQHLTSLKFSALSNLKVKR